MKIGLKNYKLIKEKKETQNYLTKRLREMIECNPNTYMGYDINEFLDFLEHVKIKQK